MTNYNERLDEMLRSLAHRAYLTAHAPGYTKLDGRTYKTAVDEAKQAITSLIKELVAEAKPGKYSSGESILNVDGIGEVDGYEGYNQAINQFEQNLLKALEEV